MHLLQAAQDRMLRNQTSAVGLGLFRIAYGAVLVGEVLHLIYFKRLVFGDLPFLPTPECSFAFVLWAWLAATVCLTLGLYTRIACVVNYVLTVATLSTFQQYEYHADHIYISLNLLLVFTPLERRLSLDSLRERLRSNALPGDRPPDTRVVRFHSDALLIVGLGLVYLDSFFWKLGQDLWTNGLGVWLPASMPHNTWFSSTVLNAALNRRVLMGVLSDLTLVFEATFLALMWLRAARPVLLLIGLGLHLSIIFAFPIPFFGLSLAAVYFLMAPPGWYEAIARRFRLSEPRSLVFFDADSARWRRLLLLLEHFDFRGALAFRPVSRSGLGSELPDGLLVVEGEHQCTGPEGLVAAVRRHPLFWPLAGLFAVAHGVRNRSRDDEYYETQSPRTAPHIDLEQLMLTTAAARKSAGASTNRAATDPPEKGRADATLRVKFALVAFCVVIQATLIPKAPCFRDPQKPHTAAPRWLADLQRAAHGYAGVCSHGVFLDGHFAGYDHIVAVTLVNADGSETWLPLTRPSGQMGWYATGRIWAKWAFRGNNAYMSIEHLKLALRDLTGFWARKNGVDLANAQFNVLVKKYDPQSGWQHDYLRRQTEKPWSPAGFVQWREGRFSAEIVEIESL